ncbi:hypothetical protein P3J6_121093 [Pseudoalteromonas sp. 3J6]|nr:hypothetical protein P3J6_121093 [Pseudoalteromonas sp. 3J6]
MLSGVGVQVPPSAPNIKTSNSDVTGFFVSEILKYILALLVLIIE